MLYNKNREEHHFPSESSDEALPGTRAAKFEHFTATLPESLLCV